VSRKRRFEQEVENFAQEKLWRRVHRRVLLSRHYSDASFGQRSTDGFDRILELRGLSPPRSNSVGTRMAEKRWVRSDTRR
jgi:hypothetical protein